MYVSKSEEPDSRLMCNILAKSLTYEGMTPSRRDILRKLITSMLSATVLGATQAVWCLLKLPFVRKSRNVLHVNTMPRGQVAQKFLNLKKLKSKMNEHGGDSSALEDAGPTSHLGRRNAYMALLKEQALCTSLFKSSEEFDPKEFEVSFHALLTGYKITKNPDMLTPGVVKCTKGHPLLVLIAAHELCLCAVCSTSLLLGTDMRTCRQCKFHLCGECFDAAKLKLKDVEEVSDADDDDAASSETDEEDDGDDTEQGAVPAAGRRKRAKQPGWGPLSKPLFVQQRNSSCINHGLCPAKFAIGHFRFKRIVLSSRGREQPVINMTPHTTYDESNERCAFALLLLHKPWPNGDESALVPKGSNAVAELQKEMLVNSALKKIMEHNKAARTAQLKHPKPIPDCYDGDGDGDGDLDSDGDGDGEIYFMPDDDITGPDQLQASQATSASGFTLLNDSLLASVSDHVQRIRRTSAQAKFQENERTPGNLAGGIHTYADHGDLAAQLTVGISGLDEDQTKVFNRANDSLLGRAEGQMLAVLSGAGGTGI